MSQSESIDPFAPGTVIFVAGGGSGIGAETARVLANRGAHVVVADLDEQAARQVARQISEAAGRSLPVQMDIADEKSVGQAFSLVRETFGSLWGLFNVAADMRSLRQDTTVLDMDMELWDRTMGVDLRGYVLTTRQALPLMLKGSGGVIVNTSSGAAYVGEPQRPAYAAAKAGVTALTRHVAARWGREGIRCNAVAPGLVSTASARQNIGQAWDAAAAANPAGRLGEPPDIASGVAFLMSREASWVNGQTICIDGGSVMR